MSDQISDRADMARILRESLAYFGENGERWSKGEFFADRSGDYADMRFMFNQKQGKPCACALGGIAYGIVRAMDIGDGQVRDLGYDPENVLICLGPADYWVPIVTAIRELFPLRVGQRTGLSSVIAFNDSENTTFEDVKHVFERAIELANKKPVATWSI